MARGAMMENMIIGADVANVAQSAKVTRMSLMRENAAEWALIFQGIAKGKTIQRVRSNGNSYATDWCDIQDQEHLDMRLPASCYRIKPETKKQWYRVALIKGVDRDFGSVNREIFYTTVTVNEKINNMNVEQKPNFIRWLTDRIEYELPEGEV